MLTGGTEGTMFEIADELFNEVVFTYKDDLDKYNARADKDAREMLFEIIGEMIDAAESAMVECAQLHKDEFLKFVRGNDGEEIA